MTYLDGIDISRWQTRPPDLSGKAFVFARATHGATVDPKYAAHKATVQAAGIVFGAYHFGCGTGTGESQAAAFLATIGDDVRLVALDLEWDAHAGRRMGNAEATAFLHAVQATGRRVGLYASAGSYPFYLPADWRWIAKWGQSAPSVEWAFWQYDNGGADGVDNDYFNGTLDQLRSMAGMKPAVTWGADVLPETRAVCSAATARSAIRKAGHEPGHTISEADLAAGCRAAGIAYGTRVNPVDLQRLLATTGVAP